LKTLSIIIPCYNEEKLISSVLSSVFSVQLNGITEMEVIVVDDCSSDSSRIMIEEFKLQHPDLPLHLLTSAKNMGKGAAVKQGLLKAKGSIILIQDADLEYNPKDYNKLLEPILDGFADVVYGSRFIGSGPHRVLFFFHTIGNKFLTFLSNLFSQLNLTDMETGYKVFRSEFIKNINLKEKSFGFEPEITAKISKIPGIRIYEVGISYYGRTYKEGKKINWKDGIKAIYCIFKYNIFSK
jgi:glycosyltransferase involved in cell wall biosynthesis